MSATRFRKKPVVVAARQVDSGDYDDLCDIVAWCGGRAVGWDGHLIAIDTLEGTMYADDGDWIIRGVKGEHYPCKPDIFEQTYERNDAVAEATAHLDDVTAERDDLERRLTEASIGGMGIEGRYHDLADELRALRSVVAKLFGASMDIVIKPVWSRGDVLALGDVEPWVELTDAERVAVMGALEPGATT